VRRVAIPLVLVVVALTQITLAHTAALTPWKGGGFGMFASMDQLETRFVRIELVDPAGDALPVAIDRFAGSADVGDLLERARALPDQGSLEAVAERVRTRRWTQEDGTAVPSADEELGDTVDLQLIRVSVWVYLYDRSERALVPERLAETSVPAG
jgi:hypothetical protein